MTFFFNLLSRRSALKIGAASALLSTSIVAPATRAGADDKSRALRKRKNIDMLTSDELENYKHALGILKQRSAADPSRQDGYQYQAELHNKPRRHPDSSTGACEHGSEQFFPWHRPHLAGFEELLRVADPPRTADVTIPYWDWTKQPSGRMTPTAFEDQNSPLFNAGRRTSGPPPMWDGEDIRQMVREPEWDLFAGRPKGPTQSFGFFEDTAHNQMHGDIGTTMGNPRTASNDPIYWSFHAYVDLVWARWQRLHPQIFGCGNCTLWLEPNSYRVDEKVKTEDWGYEYDYDFSADGTLIAVADREPTSTALPMNETSNRAASAKLTAPVGGKREIFKIEKVRPLPDITYRIGVYLHPADVRPDNLSAEQRRQYLVRMVTIWQSAGHHPDASDVLVDLTQARAKAGPNQTVSVITEDATSPDEAAARSQAARALPKIQELLRGFSIEEH